MIADAVATLIALGWALAAWIFLCAVFATLALYAVATIAWWVLRAAGAALAAAASFCTHSRRCSASEGDGGGFPVPSPERASERRTAPHPRPEPHWAHTDKDAA